MGSDGKKSASDLWTLAASREAEHLASASNVAAVLPAGSGKTELIAHATGIASETTGRQLILTHTHAGVHALRTRLSRLGIKPRSYMLSTITGWALKWSVAYPSISELPTAEPTTPNEWDAICRGAVRVLNNPHLAAAVGASYGGAFVDEYQDCTLQQHQISIKLSQLMPLRVLGDPLQGIFGFRGQEIQWSRDVAPTFPPLEIESHPWRWVSSNPELGERLLELRQSLLNGQSIDLTTAPISWGGQPNRKYQVACCQRLAARTGSTVALLKWADECHKFSKVLNGMFSSMDELESKDLLQFAKDVDDADTGYDAASVILDLIRQCFTRLPPTVKVLMQNLSKYKLPSIKANTSNVAFVKAIHAIVEAPTPTNLLIAAKEVEGIRRVFVHRPELWRVVKRSIAAQRDENIGTTREAAVAIRDRTRERGRAAEPRTVSRTLLVKGLEYDHAAILDADALNAKEFYVAATRGRQTLTVFSNKPQLQFAVPKL